MTDTPTPFNAKKAADLAIWLDNGCEPYESHRHRLNTQRQAAAQLRAAVHMAEVVRKYLAALDVISDANDRGVDDSGKRPTDSYASWLIKDCAYTEALAELRDTLKDKP